MALSELRRRYPTQAAVRSHLVVVLAPVGNLRARLLQGLEPMFAPIQRPPTFAGVCFFGSLLGDVALQAPLMFAVVCLNPGAL